MTWQEKAKTKIQSIIDENAHLDLSDPKQLKDLKHTVSKAYNGFNPWRGSERKGFIYNSWLNAVKSFGLHRDGNGPTKTQTPIKTPDDLRNFWIS